MGNHNMARKKKDRERVEIDNEGFVSSYTFT